MTKQSVVDPVAEAKRRILETLERIPWTTGKRPPFVQADVRLAQERLRQVEQEAGA